MANDKTEALLARLAEGVATLQTSEGWQRWLAVQAEFYRYSFGNCFLIMMQRPEATHVAGFHKWLELGRHVNAGEHGIRILAPCVVKVQRNETSDRDGDQPSDDRRLVGFRSAAVFDISQTCGEPLPDAPMTRQLVGDAPADVLPALLRFARSEEIGVCFVPQSELGTSNGRTLTGTRAIEVSDQLSPAMTCKTLAHELGHALMHVRNFTGERAQAELEAESVAYLVCNRAGIDSAQYSFGYVVSWAGRGVGTKDTTAALQASGQRIVKAAQLIGDAIEKKQAAAAELVAA